MSTTSDRPVAESRPEWVAQLRAVMASDGVPERCVRLLATLGTPRSIDRGETIVEEGAGADRFWIVLRGYVKRYRELPTGRKVILAIFGPGEIFGAVAALGQRDHDASLAALEDVVCLEVGRRQLFDLFAGEPHLIGEILPVLTRRLAECNNCVVELSCYRVEMRLAQLLLKLARALGIRRPEGAFIPISLTRQELADMTGTTIESSIRVMSRWGKEGVVRTRKDGFLVPDLAALEELGRA